MGEKNYFWLFTLGVLILLSAFLWQSIATLSTTAATFDEVPHLAAGYVQLTTGNYYLNQEHPPLAKLAAAAAIRPIGGEIEDLGDQWKQVDEWEFGRIFLFGNGRDHQRLLFRGRLAIIAIGLLLCIGCLIWSYQLYGPVGALTTLALAVFCPNIIAYTRLILTDIPIAAFALLATYAAWQMLAQPKIYWAIIAGIFLGAALTSKYSALLFPPVFGLLFIYCVGQKYLNKLIDRSQVIRYALLFAVMITFAVLVIFACYGLQPTFQPYLEGMRKVGINHHPDYPDYLLGNFKLGGYRYYFLMAFILKVSPAVLVATVLYLILLLAKRFPNQFNANINSRETYLFLLLPALIYSLVFSWKAPNTIGGIRYILPIFPFLFVLLGALGNLLWSMRKGRVVLVVLLALHIYAAVDAYPDPISYFNGLLGCKGTDAINCLDGACLDLGQDLGRVAKELEHIRKPYEQVRLLYFGSADPNAYLTNWQDVEPDEIIRPRAQLYVVSVHALNRLSIGAPAGINWFNRFRPLGSIGNTYLIYDFRR
ncbi:MAG: phospholipid carrier-dependent glycosyltransferase [Acidobacteriota bacterium]